MFGGGDPLLLDGGIGSALIAQGLEAGQAPERWLLEHPERVADVHRAYVAAGCDIIQTNTFGANPARLAHSDQLAGRCAEINSLAVALAREAAGSSVLVAGNIGPVATWLPRDEAPASSLQQAFEEQASALAAAGVDLISIETMCDLREALAALRAAIATELPVIVSMCFEEHEGGFCSLAGDPLEISLHELAEGGATALGFNCNLDPAQALSLARQALPLTDLPLVLQPCAGQPQLGGDRPQYPTTASGFVSHQLGAVGAGVAAVGGCCGTTPEFIAALRTALDDRSGGDAG